MRKSLRQLLASAAAGLARLAEPPAQSPAHIMLAGLLSLGFTEQEHEGRRVLLLQRGTLLATVSNIEGAALPGPDDWSITVYNTEAPAWPDRPAEAAMLHARANMMASYHITMAAALAHLNNNQPVQGE